MLSDHACRSEEAEEQAAQRLTGELAQERRERSSLSLQLHEAMETIASRDQAIEGLRRSLSEEMERARHPPIAARAPTLPNSANSSLGHIHSVLATGHRHHTSQLPEASLVPPLPTMGAVRDGTSSVCRVSTESTTFASHTAAEAPPSVEPIAGAWVSPASAFQWSGDRPPPMPPMETSFNASSLRSVSLESSGAFGNVTCDTASTTATRNCSAKNMQASSSASGQTADAPRPWELPPQDFLALWRRSRSSVLPAGVPSSDVSGSATPSRTISQVQDIAVPASAETLRITTSFQ